MLAILGGIIGRVSDNRRLALLASLVCGILLGGVEYAVMQHVVAGLPPWYGALLDAAIIALGAAGFAWTLLAGNRDRRHRVQKELEGIAELNHEVRNALQVIAHSQYRAEPDCRDMVLCSVSRIDAALRRLAPLLGIPDPAACARRGGREQEQ